MVIGFGDVSVALKQMNMSLQGRGFKLKNVLNTSPESLDCMACLDIYIYVFVIFH